MESELSKLYSARKENVNLRNDLFSALEKKRFSLEGEDSEYITGLQLLKNIVRLEFNEVSKRPVRLDFGVYSRRISFDAPFLGEIKVAHFNVSSANEKDVRKVAITEMQVGSLLACFNRFLENRSLLSPEELSAYKLEELVDIRETTNIVELRSAEEAFVSKKFEI